MNGQANPVRTLRLSRLGLVLVLVFGAVSARAASDGGLELIPDFTTTLPLLILVFLVIVSPLNALLFRPLLKAIDEREERTAGTRAKAERLAAEAQGVLERYEGAVRQARDESELARRGRLDQARSEMLETTSAARSAAETEIERARAELAATLDGARETLRGHANELAREAAARVLGRDV